MFPVARRFLAVVLGATAFAAAPLLAQNAEPKPAEAGKADAAKEAAGRTDEMEAARLMTGPAGRLECVWLGFRAVSLMWKDDLDTAFRHLELYDRFGCPRDHVQLSFRCFVSQGNLDPKDPKAFDTRIKNCWVNPALPPAPANPPTAVVEKPGTK